MATAELTAHPASAPEREGVAPQITIAEDTALVSYVYDDEVVTELWLLGTDGWRNTATHTA
jgi:hypothetical protein